MPFFHFPHFPFQSSIGYYNSNYYRKFSPQQPLSNKSESNIESVTTIKPQKNSSKNNENYFFELFGLNLYFDDVLLICLIFFLYQEGVKDEELFISLLLLLLS